LRKLIPLKQALEPAKGNEYLEWLACYLKTRKHIPTADMCVYNSMPPELFCTVKKGIKKIKITPLYGSESLNIVVPKGVSVVGEELGHINLYLMDGCEHRGVWIPIYKNIKFKNKELSEKMKKITKNDREEEKLFDV